MAFIIMATTTFAATFLPCPILPRNCQSVTTSTKVVRSTSDNNSSINMSVKPYNLQSLHFEPMEESMVSIEQSQSRRYLTDMISYADVVILSASSIGLSCAYELSKNPNISVAIIEQSVTPSGGARLNGQLFFAMVVHKPAHLFVFEIGVDYDDREDYVVVKHTTLFTSTILRKLLVRPNVKLFNVVGAEDLIVKEGRVGGVVTNWTLVSINHHVIQANVVVSLCDHNPLFGVAGLKLLKRVGMSNFVGGTKSLDMIIREDAVVQLTKEVVPGFIISGMEVAEKYGTPSVGPTFGAMMISGQKATHLALKALGKNNELVKKSG